MLFYLCPTLYMLSGVQAHQVASVACTLLCVRGLQCKHAPCKHEAKLDELASLRSRIPFISQSALSSILKIAATEGLPAITTRRGVREARDKFVGITTPHGPLHTHISVESVTIEVQNPFAVFWYACKTTGRGGKTRGINQRLLRGS